MTANFADAFAARVRRLLADHIVELQKERGKFASEGAKVGHFAGGSSRFAIGEAEIGKGHFFAAIETALGELDRAKAKGLEQSGVLREIVGNELEAALELAAAAAMPPVSEAYGSRGPRPAPVMVREMQERLDALLLEYDAGLHTPNPVPPSHVTNVVFVTGGSVELVQQSGGGSQQDAKKTIRSSDEG